VDVWAYGNERRRWVGDSEGLLTPFFFLFSVAPDNKRYRALMDCQEWHVICWASASIQILFPVGGYLRPFSSANFSIAMSSAGTYLLRLAMMIRYQLQTKVTRNDTFKTPNFGPDFSYLYLTDNLTSQIVFTPIGTPPKYQRTLPIPNKIVISSKK